MPALSLPDDVTWTCSPESQSLFYFWNFAYAPPGQKQCVKGECSPLPPTVGVNVVSVCPRMCLSVLLGFYDSVDLEESQGKPFCFCWRAVCLPPGPSSGPLPTVPWLRLLSALCVYKHSQVGFALNHLLIKMLTQRERRRETDAKRSRREVKLKQPQIGAA